MSCMSTVFNILPYNNKTIYYCICMNCLLVILQNSELKGIMTVTIFIRRKNYKKFILISCFKCTMIEDIANCAICRVKLSVLTSPKY